MSDLHVSQNLSSHERHWAMAVHGVALLSALLTSWAAGVAGMLGAAAVLWARPLGSDFVREHAKEAFNFNFSMFVYAAIAFVFSVITLGLGVIVVIPLAVLWAIAWIVCTVSAALRAQRGQAYRYPLTWRVWR